MDGTLAGTVVVPGLTALLVFFILTHLYHQSHAAFFRAWQLGWALYVCYFTLNVWSTGGHPVTLWLAKLALLGAALCAFVSTRLLPGEFRFKWYDFVLATLGTVWAAWNVVETSGGKIAALALPFLRVEVGIAALLLMAAYRLWNAARLRDSLALRLTAFSISLWAFLLALHQADEMTANVFSNLSHFLGTLPQMLLAIAMVMVQNESERRSLQENLLAFSSLDTGGKQAAGAADLTPILQKLLDRLGALFRSPKAAICIAGPYRETLPSVESCLTPEFLERMERDGGSESLSELLRRHSGVYVIPDLDASMAAMTPEDADRYRPLRECLRWEKVGAISAAALQTREHDFGFVLFTHPPGGQLGATQQRLLASLARQLALTLENYTFMYDAQRRTQEFELLTQIGQVVSSRLDPDEALLAVQRELGKVLDTSTFYVAFQFGDTVRFELDVDQGELQPKRTRPAGHGLTEYIIRTGKPVVVRSGMEEFRKKHGLVAMGRPAKCFCGVPIVMYNRPVGVMAAMHYTREFVYDQRDVDVMTTAAGQVAVAIENARMFAEEQRRSRYLAFLNNISKTAISSQDAEQMLPEIVAEIQKNFHYDHIGIGILDYVTKDIEIKAEAGTTAQALGKRVPLGAGILGRVARTGEMQLVQNTSEGHLLGILAGSKSALCIPISYGETMLGVLNVESQRENAFAEQDVLILRTLADLLATALHNVFVFQKMQHQSITDALTGIKTRRYFLEALQSEWKRASRSGRPFSMVVLDLDKFKEVNDTMGHLEGDLVLARIGRLLEQKVRQSNVVARYGGDEFMIMMPETGVEQAQILSERLRLWIATDPMLNERHVTGSFGVATFPMHGATVEDVMRVADEGMYISKRAGGNRVSTADQHAAGGEGELSHRQTVNRYVESFLRREDAGPDSVHELVATLTKLASEAEEADQAEILMNALRALTRAAEAREVSASGHGEAVARYAESIGRELMLSPDELAEVLYAARVHDVGKIVIPEEILNKPGSLTQAEYQVTKAHPAAGAQLVAIIPDSERAQSYVRHHHERFDGTGYPSGLKGEAIPLGARIISVAEAYLSMTMERPYAPVKSQNEAVAELEALSGVQFDGMLVRLFIQQLKGEKVRKNG
jgi:diguanylate cyclase (GGDEF)-like protein